MNLVGIRTYLEPELAREVARAASAQGRSESSVIAEILRGRFAATSDAASASAADAQKRQLTRIEARIDRLQRDQALKKEALLVFVRIWLEHNPPIDDAIAESISASADARFERFLELVVQGLQPGRSITEGDGESVTGANGHDDEADLGAPP